MMKIDPTQVVLNGYVQDRIKRNKNFIMVINGPTGDGKTYSALTLCHIFAQVFGTQFSVKDNIGFDFKSLLKKMRNKGNDKPGTPFLFEEVGVTGSGGSNREWQSQANRFFSSFLQTARHRNQILIFTCPRFRMLEKQARSLVHIQASTIRINFRKKMVMLKPYMQQINERTDKSYFKWLRYNKEGVKSKLKQLNILHPPMDLTIEYEKAKTRYTDKLYSSMFQEDKKKQGPHNRIDPESIYILADKGILRKQIAKILHIDEKTVTKYMKLRDEKAVSS